MKHKFHVASDDQLFVERKGDMIDVGKIYFTGKEYCWLIDDTVMTKRHINLLNASFCVEMANFLKTYKPQ